MYFVRGNKLDYDNWADQGNAGWNWANVIHYFKKLERFEDLSNNPGEYRGTNGYLGVTQQSWEDQFYFDAFKENGHNILQDINGEEQMGYSSAQFSIADGIRQSTAAAYLMPTRQRKNLHVLKNTLARRILFDEHKRVVGIEVATDGEILKIKSKREVILSAGAVNTPQLLMVSGVGPKDHLSEMGIKVIHDSKNVGENLQDHTMVHIMLTSRNYSQSPLSIADIRWGEFPVPAMMGFVALNRTKEFPDYQSTVSPLAYGHLLNMVTCTQVPNLKNDVCLEVIKAGNKGETLHAFVTLLHPESRGRIRLKSRHPEYTPLIFNGYFSNKEDITNLAKYVEDYVSVINASNLRNADSQIVDTKLDECKGFVFGSHDYWKCYVLNVASTHYHLVGSCAMGPKGKGVLDERLKVRGVEGLRVADASVMPTIISGNTNAPVIMIAEKASDMIKVDHGIPTV
jgi:choline dehydrogenase-like flavoprotein